MEDLVDTAPLSEEKRHLQSMFKHGATQVPISEVSGEKIVLVVSSDNAPYPVSVEIVSKSDGCIFSLSKQGAKELISCLLKAI